MNTIDKQKKNIAYLRIKENRLHKRVQTLKDLVVILKKTKKVSNNCQLVLEV